ncbi:MAG: glycoside hydrolase family 130 protein [Treponema sp.]|nr:glycoside hydrolase family 130 protein [Treponema sp.]
MSSIIVNGNSIPNIPWEDRPSSSNPEKEIMWRFTKNPVIPRNLTVRSNSIFNSAVVPFNGEFAGVFRCDDTARHMDIHAGRSKDGVNWVIEDNPIKFIKTDSELPDSDYKYDPRVIFIEDRYYLIWCNGYHGPCLGMGYTYDFEKFYQMENTMMPYNRNGAFFPRKIGKNYAMYSRPSDSGHTPFGDMWYSESPDFIYWGKHRHVMAPSGGWQSTKIGAGPCPIETSEGWLVFYHGVLTSCNGFVYSFSAALMDLDKPWKVIARPRPYIINPREIYELAGDVPNVTFPVASLVDKDSGKVAIYYGCADTVTGLVFGKVDEIINWVKTNKM